MDQESPVDKAIRLGSQQLLAALIRDHPNILMRLLNKRKIDSDEEEPDNGRA